VSVEEIRLDVQVPESVTVARIVEVHCGASRVTIRQVMGPSDEEWTVYEGDGFDQGRNKGLVGKIDKAPRGDTAEALLPWASDLVTRRERKRLALAALVHVVDDQPHAVEET
jgi:hypothetical protein